MDRVAVVHLQPLLEAEGALDPQIGNQVRRAYRTATDTQVTDPACAIKISKCASRLAPTNRSST
jgi:hypothetical protein